MTTQTTYRELQQRAKALGLNAGGTRQTLELALTTHDAQYHSEPQPELDAHILAYCEAQVELAAMADPMYDFTTGAQADRDALAELIADGTLTTTTTKEPTMTTPEYTTGAPMSTEPTTTAAPEPTAPSYADLAAMRAAHFNQAMKAHSAVMAERLSSPQTEVVFHLPKTSMLRPQGYLLSRLDPRNLLNRVGLGGLTVTVDEADVARTVVEDHDAHVRAHELSQSLYMGWAVDVAGKGQTQVGTRETKADVKRAQQHVRAAIAALRHAGYCDDHAVVADLERLMLTLGQCEGFKLPGMLMPTMYRSGSDGVLPQCLNQLQGQVIQVERITASGKVKDPMTGKAMRKGAAKCACGKPVFCPGGIPSTQCFRCTPNAPTTPVVKASPTVAAPTVATVSVPTVQVPVTTLVTVRPSTTTGKAPSSPVAASKPLQATSTLPTPVKPVLEAARAVPTPTAVVTPVAAPIPTPIGYQTGVVLADLEAAAAVLYRTAGNIRSLQCRCQLAGIPWTAIEAKMTLCRKLAAKGVTL